MIETLGTLVAWALQLYLLIGVLAASVLSLRGLHHLDPAAAGSSLGFRAIVFPGLVALWPLMLARTLSGKREPGEETNAHRTAARRK